MRNGESGFALIMVLVMLALGALIVTPSLRLANTSLKSKAIHTEILMDQYARDGAAEYAIWQLQWGTVTSELTTEGQESASTVTLNGITPNVIIKLRANPQEGGVTLATDDVIRPTKTVSPNAHSLGFQTYTYTITLEQVSDDTSQGLDAVYDILPKNFAKCNDPPDVYYVTGSSYLDGVSISDPDCSDNSVDPLLPKEPILRWPATGSFTSPIRDFQPGQKKVLTFQYYARLDNNETHCNWVVLKPWNTVSGKQAGITVGAPTDPGCEEFESVEVSKTSDPSLIPPNTEIVVTYTIDMSASGDSSVDITRITDYLPPGFTYCGPPDPAPPPPAGGTIHADCIIPTGEAPAHPTLFLENVNGVDRWRLIWDCAVEVICTGSPDNDEVQVEPGDPIKTITFTAKTTQDTSGNYFNEVFLQTDMRSEAAFTTIGVTDADFGGAVGSWNTGMVSVPAYDIKSEGERSVGQGNVILEAAGAVLDGWNIESQ